MRPVHQESSRRLLSDLWITGIASWSLLAASRDRPVVKQQEIARRAEVKLDAYRDDPESYVVQVQRERSRSRWPRIICGGQEPQHRLGDQAPGIICRSP